MIFNSMVHWTDREKQWEVDIGGWYGILKSITISWLGFGWLVSLQCGYTCI